MTRRIVAALVNAGLFAGLLTSGIVGGAAPATAVSATTFDPGMIITDSAFYDSNAMTAAQVQTFLDKKVLTCREDLSTGPNDPIVCLKDYTQKTTAKSADAYCKGYSAVTQTAAQIINGVARACGVSQKVLLVLLQKEQGLVTNTYPSQYRYTKATGFACPDTAACDTQYAGFFNQVYMAARQFKKYRANPNSYGYVAGMTNYIQWNPTKSCGGSYVTIRNQATAGLYIYTPYQPNQAALNAGYGSGNSCSSYGNRNFFLYYNDWFGSAPPTAADLVAADYLQRGGESKLGTVVSGPVTVGKGAYLQTTTGYLFVDPDGDSTFMGSDWRITPLYWDAGGPSGSWGWPQGDRTANAEGWSYRFEQAAGFGIGGAPVVLTGAMYTSYARHGGESSLGIPVGRVVSPTGGSYIALERAYVYVTTAGKVTFQGASWSMTKTYWANGGPTGAWGWPLGSRYSVSGGWAHPFTNAIAYGVDGAVRIVDGAMHDAWVGHGGDGTVGIAVADPITSGDGTYQEFTRGHLFLPAAGGSVFLASGWRVPKTYWKSGGPTGSWGWPVRDRATISGGYRFDFTHATVWAVEGKVRILQGAMYDTWLAEGGTTTLGAAIANAQSTAGGSYQHFFKGDLFVTSGGSATVLSVKSPVTSLYWDAGGPDGLWGWPLGDPVTVDAGDRYEFEHATVTVVGGAVTVASTPMYDAWSARGGASSLGSPITAAVTTAAGTYQRFANGDLFLDSSGASVYYGAKWRVPVMYWKAGGPDGSWGWPLSNPVRVSGGSRFDLSHATVWSVNGKARVLTGAPYDAWTAAGGERSMGTPTTNAVTAGGGTYQRFTKADLYLSPNGKTVRFGSSWRITASYWNNGGPKGAWGYPTRDRVAITGGYRFAFEYATVKIVNGKVTVIKK
ncbi:LGFP repeat-containing protein [Demequina soli]|uniref:LGFP repeat-containing protein n=1 Tax=Demequina soli TaxID=1638987 RepID=UPI000785DF5A|nr:hypothetical protein [Demequina soli]